MFEQSNLLVNWKYWLTIYFCGLVTIFGCSTDEHSFDSQSILGRYEGQIIFQQTATLDTALLLPCEYNILENGDMIFTRLDNLEADTSEWYINESAETIVINTKFFLGTSINDVITWSPDSLVFTGSVRAAIGGAATEYLRTARLKRQ